MSPAEATSTGSSNASTRSIACIDGLDAKVDALRTYIDETFRKSLVAAIAIS
jgi:hypothetical protein